MDHRQGRLIEAHPIEFNGRGHEYFRVWIVNVLLSLLTLGFFTPWARRRTAQYFYGHTSVAQSPLEFTAPQRKMTLGFLVFVGLSLAYKLAAGTGQDAWVAFFVLGGAALMPWIWRNAMRFRLSATRWRGLRFQFQVPLKSVYLASWPLFAMALGLLGGGWVLQALWPHQRTDAAPVPFWGASAFGLAYLGALILALIRLEYNHRRLLVQGTQLGAETGRWKPVYLDFVRVWGATVGFFILTAGALGVGLAVLIRSTVGWPQLQPLGWGMLLVLLAYVVGGFLVLALASAPARAYREARLFQLLWNNIGLGGVARFKCQLSTGRFVVLRLRNLVLTLLTLGLYRPYARVSEYRMKAQSVTLYVKGGVEQVAGQLVLQQQNGVSDALAEAAGFELVN